MVTPQAKPQEKSGFTEEVTAVSSTFSASSGSMQQSSPEMGPIDTTRHSVQRLQEVWASALKLELEDFGPEDDFFQLGGDSLIAMRIVSDARKVSLKITVQDIFCHPTARALAAVAESTAEDEGELTVIPSFSLLPNELALRIREDVANAYNMDFEAIEDIYPCVALQEGLFVLTQKHTKQREYVTQRTLTLDEDVDVSRFESVWESVFQRLAILRTRTCQHAELEGMLQVVVRESIDWATGDDLEAYLEEDMAKSMGLGEALTRFAIIKDPQTSKVDFVWTMHHALYDAVSTALILELVNAGYHDKEPSTKPVDFKYFVQHCQQQQSGPNEDEYWRGTLSEFGNVAFPIPMAATPTELPSMAFERRCRVPVDFHSPGVTTSTLIKAAWALALYHMEDIEDVVFGTTVSGRNAGLVGIENVVGPTIATIPKRIRIPTSAKKTISEFLLDVQQEDIRGIPHEQTGLQRIRRLSPAADMACDFQTLLVVQAPDEEVDQKMETLQSLGTWSAESGKEVFSTYPLTLNCYLEQGGKGFRTETKFDTSVVEVCKMRCMLTHFEHLVRQLGTMGTERLSTIHTLFDSVLEEAVKDVSFSMDKASKHLLPAFIRDTLEAGVRAWVASVDNHDRLVPFGAAGELLIEGPADDQIIENVADQVVKKSPISTPAWLSSHRPASRGFATGHIVRRIDDGLLLYCGAKSDRIEVRGHKVFREEIERRMAACLEQPGQVVVNVDRGIVTAYVLLRPGNPSLISQDDNDNVADKIEVTSPRTFTPSQTCQHLLARCLPKHLLPAVLVEIQHGSDFVSHGKLDRSKLRHLDTTQLASLANDASNDGQHAQPTTEIERVLQKLWAVALRSEDVSLIRPRDDFFHLGGDSILAMKLVAEARASGLVLTVADIFRCPQLSTMADAAEVLEGDATSQNCLPYCLVPDLDLQQLADEYGLQASLIENVFPCTSLQESLLSLTSKNSGKYVHRAILELNSDVDVSRFRHAWDLAVQHIAILRTSIVVYKQRLLQVVMPRRILWDENSGGVQGLFDQSTMTLGTPLARFALIELSASRRLFAWSIHHALYDSPTVTMVWDFVNQAYHEQPIKPPLGFDLFVKHVEEQHRTDTSRQFWANTFNQYESDTFPSRTSRTSGVMTLRDGRNYEIEVKLPPKTGSTTTIATLVKAAWALTVHQISGHEQQDVVFGVTASGRTANLSGIERIAGPTIATTPFRAQIPHGTTSIQSFLQSIQDFSTRLIPFEQTGLTEIAKASSSAKLGTDFRTLVVIQPPGETQKANSDFGIWNQVDNDDDFSTYDVNLIASMRNYGGLNLLVNYDRNTISHWEMEQVMNQFAHTLRQLAGAARHQQLAEVSTISPQQLSTLKSWNRNVPSLIETTVDETIAQWVCQTPNATAVEGWDGKLSYQALESQSNALADDLLNDHGVHRGCIVPVCFNKSVYAVVAMLAVMKAGCAFVPLDARSPDNQRKVLSQLNVSVILTSEALKNSPIFDSYDIIAVGPSQPLTSGSPSSTTARVRCHTSEATAYYIFTSGSTGEPKGISLSHRAVSTSCHHHGSAIGYDGKSRVLQFASYIFDVSIQEIITTLIFGGCVCVPSEHDRVNSLDAFINSYNVNMALLTPTVARLLQPEQLPSLSTIMLGGEKASSGDFERWCGYVSLALNGYGPAECAVCCAINVIDWDSIQPHCIGFTVGGSSWVVSTSDPEKLVPLGSVGELLIEGYIVADGYLADSDRTAAAFIPPPTWLQAFRGERTRVYLTGDLVRYDSDGKLTYLGRKDTQIKLHGQRVDLAGIEYQLREALASTFKEWSGNLAVEVVSLSGSNVPVLVAFIDNPLIGHNEVEKTTQVTAEEHVGPATAIGNFPESVRQHLAAVLPPHLIPNACLQMATLPLNSSGKLDRKRLRDEELVVSNDTGEDKPPPTTPTQRLLHELIAAILGLPCARIGIHDNFFYLGGDSVSAMKLVGEARKSCVQLSVADIFRCPSVFLLAEVASTSNYTTIGVIPPFSLLGEEVDATNILQDLCAAYGFDLEDIEDMYPCTPLQEGVISLSSRQHGDYVSQNAMKLVEGVDQDLFESAWGHTARLVPILRTRIVDTRLGLMQLVLKKTPIWTTAASLSEHLRADRAKSMGLSDALVRFAWVNSDAEGAVHFVWTIHHALYDGVSVPLIRDIFEKAYFQVPIDSHGLSGMNGFVKYLGQQSPEVIEAYWTSTLSGYSPGTFPSLPSEIRQPISNSVSTISCGRLGSPKSNGNVTTATRLRVAWALVAYQNTGHGDQVYGATVSGRQAAVPHIEEIIGPTLATVPIRIEVSSRATLLSSLLRSAQDQTIAMIPFEQAGLQRIAKMSTATEQACQFQTLLVVQPPREDTTAPKTRLGGWSEPAEDALFSTYALILTCYLGDEIVIEANYDSRVTPTWRMDRILQHFKATLHSMHEAGETKTVGDICAISEADLAQVWHWNAKVPKAVDRLVHDIIEEALQDRPTDEVAMRCGKEEVRVGEIMRILKPLAHKLHHSHGVEEGMVIPILSEKSIWVPIAFTSVLKAGAGFLLLDPALPEARLKETVSQIKHSVLLCSEGTRGLAERLTSVSVAIIGPDLRHLEVEDSRPIPQPEVSSAMYAIFTSGSTGAPKGAIVPHRSVATALSNQLSVIGYNKNSRHCDFSAYSFDIAIHNAMAILITGGLLVIATDEERRMDVRSTLIRNYATSSVITPSNLRPLIAEGIPPTLTSMGLVGEALTREDVRPWIERGIRTFNVYGPSECTSYTTINNSDSMDEATKLGVGLGCRIWVVDPTDHNILVPVGAVGELLIEGHTIGKEYIQDPERTAAFWIHDPDFLTDGAPGHAGRRARLYKSGDLGCYDKNGVLSFVSRKDTQVKIRGQRVELGEIEHHLRRILHQATAIASELVLPQGGDTPILVTFMAIDPKYSMGKEWQTTKERCIELGQDATADVVHLAPKYHDQLIEHLPSHMVPSVTIILSSFPINNSGKTDRKRIKEIGALFTVEQLVNSRNLEDVVQPTTKAERALQRLWSHILKLAADSISVDDNFFRLGGDSISAVKLIGEARRSGLGLALSVADVFDHPRLGAMASLSETRFIDLASVVTAEAIEPFELLGDEVDIQAVCRQLGAAYGFDPLGVEDLYPCTPLQEGLIALSSKDTNQYILRRVMDLSLDEDSIENFRLAWEKVVQALPILRTRIVQLGGRGLYQVVLDEGIQWLGKADKTVENYLVQDRAETMGLGQPLSRYGLVKNQQSNQMSFVWTIHHALFDAHMMPIVRRLVSTFFDGGSSIVPVQPFNVFVKHAIDQVRSETATQQFWVSTFEGYDSSLFPPPVSASKTPTPNENLEVSTKAPPRSSFFTTATIIRAAWAMTVAKEGSSDVVFGLTVSGKNIDIRDVEVDHIVGPTIATVPIRIRVRPEDTVAEYLGRVQNDGICMIPYEQTGLRRLAKYGPAVSRACQIQTLITVQAANDASDEDAVDMSIGTWRDRASTDIFSTYALTLVFNIDGESLRTVASFDSTILGRWQVQQLLYRLHHNISQLGASQPDLLLSGLNTLTNRDLERIWKINKTVPEAALDSTVHDLFEARAQSQLERPAIDAWDAAMSFGELSTFSSQLAQYIIARKMQGRKIPVIFGKSAYAVVSMLAVIKSGNAFVPVDASLPIGRIRGIIKQAKAPMVLCQMSDDRFTTSGSDIQALKVGADLLVDLPQVDSLNTWPRVEVTSDMYLVFTSGSTGTPKGVIIPHASFASALKHQTSTFGFTPASRHFDFMSYSFDASLWNTFGPLVAGSCLCIPSEYDRMNNLAASIASYKATSVSLTPSVARLIHDELNVETLALLGEGVSVEDTKLFWPRTRIVNAYGPAECTPNSVLSWKSESPEAAARIGSGVGAVAWVADPDNHNNLVPFGCVGELLLEGPILGNGYLNAPEQTAKAFVNNPAFVLKGSLKVPARSARMYKTGDLVRYTEDDSLEYLGRKDTQVKIRGQRVELSEVEHHVKTAVLDCQSAVADLVTSHRSGANLVLAAFLVLETDSRASHVNSDGLSICRWVPSQTERDAMGQNLPAYMIPVVFYVVDEIPINTSGKTDRKRLCQLGADCPVKPKQKTEIRRSEQKPSTRRQQALQLLYAKVLNLKAENVLASDDFFLIGGDSISAMVLVSEARIKYGLTFTVADVFKNSLLSQLAAIAIEQTPSSFSENIPNFSLLDTGGTRAGITQIVRDIAQTCQLDPESIADIYPATAQQEGLMALSYKNPGSYIMQARLVLTDDSDRGVENFKRAWTAVVRATPILRTRLVHYRENGFVQVVVNNAHEWTFAQGDDPEALGDEISAITANKPLSRHFLHRNPKSGAVTFVWTIHHSLYDGTTIPLIRDLLSKTFRGEPAPTTSSYTSFVQLAMSQNNEEAKDFWRSQLGGFSSTPFPPLRSSVVSPVPDTKVSIKVPSVTRTASRMASTTILRAAWALICYFHSNLDQDVIFGSIVSGRNAAVPGIESMVGPTIATLPIRVRIDPKLSIAGFLRGVQRQSVDMMPFEQTRLQNIIKAAGSGSAQACKFQSLLVVQPPLAFGEVDVDSGVGTWLDVQSQDNFLTYAITMVCMLQNDGSVMVDAHFDSLVVEPWKMTRLLDHFVELVSKLIFVESSITLSELSTISHSDLSEIWERNAELPSPIERLFHDIIAEQWSRDAYAVQGWDGNLTYKELDRLSRLFAVRLMKNGARPGHKIGVMLERSKWAVVALLGITRAGGAFVPLDVSQGPDRRENILCQAEITMVVSAPAHAAIDVGAGRHVIEIGEDVPLPDRESTAFTPPVIDIESPAYVLFTSGSTGNPKGVVISHRAMSSGLHYLGQGFGFMNRTRTLFFSAFTFDAVCFDVYMTLMFGGCVCIPTEEMRMTDPGRCIRELQANTFFSAPSVLRLIDPADVPTLKVLMTGGEAPQPGMQRKFSPSTAVFHCYGPTECTVMCLIHKIEDEADFDTSCVGYQVASCLWIVDPDDSHRLLPVGEVGELLVEGPNVGSGYLDAENTTKAFVVDPPWLTRGTPTQNGRSGRLYRTGDLARFDERGRFFFVGRKDNQVKIHGQRLELGEIEHHLWTYATSRSIAKQVVVEVIKPVDGESRPMLAGFLQTSESDQHSSKDAQSDLKITSLPMDAQGYLAERLPGYMLPKVFFAMDQFPALASSGKTDRKALRTMASTYTSQELIDVRSAKLLQPQRELTNTETTLRELWSNTIGVDVSIIHPYADFFALGGDSIAAMRLASVARSSNLVLSVPQIFKNPQLHAQALYLECILPQVNAIEQTDKPFTLLRDEASEFEIRRSIAVSCDLADTGNIQDAYPCTPLQSGLLALTSIDSSNYILRAKMQLAGTLDIPRFQRAWEATVKICPILRTRVTQHAKHGLLQVVLDEGIEWAIGNSINDYIELDQKRTMGVGTPLTRYAIVDQSGFKWFIWTIHHALYDGGSLPLIMNLVKAFYNGTQPANPVAYRSFVSLVQTQLQDNKTETFWDQYFDGYSSTPLLVSPDLELQTPQPDSSLERRIEGITQSTSITMATIIRAAWALALAVESNAADVVFGAVVSGREAAIADIETIVGPTIATIPVRIKLPDAQTSVGDYLFNAQQDRASVIPFEQAGLRNIAKVSPSALRASAFQTLLVVQPPELNQDDDDSSLGRWDVEEDSSGFATYTLTVICWLDRDGLRVVGNFDSTLISTTKVESLFDEFCSFIVSLSSYPERSLADIAPLLSRIPSATFIKTNGVRTANASFHGVTEMTDLQKFLRAIWASVLNIKAEKIGLHDSFFRLGGDSISAMQVSAMARAKSIYISTPDILRGKTLAVVSAEILTKSLSAVVTPVVKEIPGQEFSLGPIQKLFFELQPDVNVSFDQVFLLKLKKLVDLGDLESALQALVSRHAMLRARFHKEDGTWLQSIAPSSEGNFSLCHIGKHENQASRVCDLRESLDIHYGPLFAAALIDNDDHQQLFVAVHHLGVDLVSWRILLQDLEALLLSQPLATPSMTFRSWLSFLEAHLANPAAEPALPFEPRPQLQDYWGIEGPIIHGNVEALSFTLDEHTTLSLLGAANDAFQTQPVELMLAALYYSFGQAFPDRVLPCVFTEGHGREPWDTAIDISSTVGWFTTIFPVQTTSDYGISLIDAVRQTKDCMRSIADKGLSFLASSNCSTYTYPVEIALNYAGLYQQLEREDALFENLPVPGTWTPHTARDMTRFALFDVLIGVEQGCLTASLIFDKSMRHQNGIKAWIYHYEHALSELTTQLSKRKTELTLLDYPTVFDTQSELDTFHKTVMPRLGIEGVHEIDSIFPCTPMQTGMLIGQAKESSHYVVRADFNLRSATSSAVDLERLASSCRAVIRRHAMLRAIVVEQPTSTSSSHMHVVLKTPRSDVKLFQGEPPRSDEIILPNNGVHYQMRIYEVGSHEVILRLEMNHIMFDAHSRDILLRDLLAAYGGNLQAKPPAPSFETFVSYLRGRPHDNGEEFWTSHLDQVKPCHFPRLANSSSPDDPSTTPLVEVDGINVNKLRVLCQKHDLTVATVLQVAWAIVLRLYTGCTIPVFGVLLSGRDADVIAANDIFGPLIGMITCKSDLSEPDVNILETLKAAQADYISTLDHQTYSLSEVHHALGLGSDRLFNTSFSLQQSLPVGEVDTSAPLIVEYMEGHDPTEYDISVRATDMSGKITVVLDCNRHLLDATQATDLGRSYGDAISSIIQQVHHPVRNLSINKPATLLAADPEILPPLTTDRVVLSKLNGRTSEHLTAQEQALAKVWASVLSIDEAQIDPRDDFFDLGGDSIYVMKLVSMSRRAGFNFSVADVFKRPTIQQLACDHLGQTRDEAVKPHSLIDKSLASFTRSCFTHVGANDGRIVDMIPATSFQSQVLRRAQQAPRQAFNYVFLHIGRNMDLEVVAKACSAAIRHLPILRTRFCKASEGYIQVVFDEPRPEVTIIDTIEDLDDACNRAAAASADKPWALEELFTAFTLVRSHKKRSSLMVRLSHAQHDGLSLPIIMQAIATTLSGMTPTSSIGMASYVHAAEVKRQNNIHYWRKLLVESRLSRLYVKPTYQSAVSKVFAAKIVPQPHVGKDFTTATLLASAWSIVLATVTGSFDITFARVVAGRNSSIPGVQECIGPCVNTIFARTRLLHGMSTRGLLSQVHDQFVNMDDADLLPWEEIIKHATDWPKGTEIESVVEHSVLNNTFPVGSGNSEWPVNFYKPEFIPEKIMVTSSSDHNGDLVISIAGSSEMLSQKHAETLVEAVALLMQGIPQWLDEPILEIPRRIELRDLH